MRVAFIDAHRHRWPVAGMCRTIGFSERTYYAARVRPPSGRQVADQGLKVHIRRGLGVQLRLLRGTPCLAGPGQRGHHGGPLHGGPAHV